MGRFWTIPNILSLSRLALIPAWWWIMASPEISDVWGGVLIIYGIISDVLDGYLARRLHQTSEWGRILDPVGDKIAALAIGLFCVIHRDMPVLALSLTIARDLGIVIGGAIIYRGRHVVPPSANIGRYAALMWGITLLLYAFEWQPIGSWLLWPAVGLYLFAGLVYVVMVTKGSR